MKYHRVAERHFLIYERGLIWEGEVTSRTARRGALISVADNMLIMICGDGDFRVNLRKRHEVDPRWEFRVFERRRGWKILAAFLMPNWRGSLIIGCAMPSVCLEHLLRILLQETQFCTFYITLLPHFVTFQFLSPLTFFPLYIFLSSRPSRFAHYFSIFALKLRRINYFYRATQWTIAYAYGNKHVRAFIVRRSKSGGSIYEKGWRFSARRVRRINYWNIRSTGGQRVQ